MQLKRSNVDELPLRAPIFKGAVHELRKALLLKLQSYFQTQKQGNNTTYSAHISYSPNKSSSLSSSILPEFPLEAFPRVSFVGEAKPPPELTEGYAQEEPTFPENDCP